MPRYPKAESLKHGQVKQIKQFMLTPTASDKIDAIADALGLSRSEALEQAIRAGGLDILVGGDTLKKPLRRRSQRTDPPLVA